MGDPNDTSDTPADEADPTEGWDPVEIMKARAAAARGDRDRSIAELRERLSDEQIRDQFGIELDELGD